MMMQSRPRAARGNALMLTLVALTVLMVLVGGAIQFTNRNREAATEKIRGERIGMCVDAARRHLLSRLSLQQVPTKSLELFSAQLIDDPTPEARTNMLTGHYGGDVETTVTTVDAVTMGAASGQAVTVGNVYRSSAILGGQYYRVVVKCQEPSGNPATAGRESEVEFLFRYGI